MKKLTLCLAILLILPVSALALTPMTDQNLEDVTGQAGVSISVDDIAMDIGVGNFAWGDADGLASNGTSTDAGYISFNNIKIRNFWIDRLIDYSNRTGTGSMDAMIYAESVNGWRPYMYKKLTFDVCTIEDSATLSSYLENTEFFTATNTGTVGSTVGDMLAVGEMGDTYLRIGLPTVRVSINEMTIDSITLVSDDGLGNTVGHPSSTQLNGRAAGTAPKEQPDSMGSITMYNFRMDMRSGNVSIYAH